MSDLLYSVTHLSAPPQACTEPPPETTRRGGLVEDPCHLEIAFVEEGGPSGRERTVRFDRLGDQFVLSSTNSLEIREWFESHSNTSQIFSELRLLNGILRVSQISFSAGTLHILMILAQYVMTGEIHEANQGREIEIGSLELGRGLLEIFADNREDLLGPFLGQLQVLRRGAWLPEGASDRLRWVTSMLDLVPQYRNFRLHLMSEADLENFYQLSSDRQGQLQAIIDFCGTLVVANSMRRPLRFDERFLGTHDAYRSLYGAQIDSGERPDFCTALEEALREMRGARGGADNRFVGECRLALSLQERNPEEAIRDSFRASLLSSQGLCSLQETIAEESEAANMPVDWLAQRGERGSGGRLGEALRILLRHLEVEIPVAPGSSPELSVNIPALRADLQTLVDANPTTRREYLLASIALLRRLSGQEEAHAAVRVFFRDNFQEVALRETVRNGLRRLLATMEDQQESSQERSDVALPIIEGAVCALGGVGLVLSETLPEIREDSGLRLGMGTPSALLSGAGCTALLGHFVWPEIAEVRNHYLWDGLTGLVGGALGVGVYLLFQVLGGGNRSDHDMRFPVDEYGP